MRFVFISTMPGSPWGGSEELWSQAAVRLRAAGHEVGALTEDNPPRSPKLTALAEQGVEVRVQRTPPGALQRALWASLTGRAARNPYREWLLEQRPNLVVISQGSNTDGGSWMEFCREFGLPYVAIVQCNAEIAWPADKDVDQLAESYLLARAVYCVSRHNLRLLEWQLGAGLPNAQVVWNPNQAAELNLLPWPADTGKMRMACVARLEPGAKGQDVLLQTLALPQWRARGVELNLYGAGPFEKTLRAMAQHLALDGVNFCGHVANVADIWRANHVLVLPSRQEGMSLALIEAMSCGRPAVVTEVGGNAELCVEGKTGFIATAPAVGPLGGALERAWARRAEWPEMGRRARARVFQLLPPDPVATFCQLLEESASVPRQSQLGARSA
jgi:glycosyltransferase involved in cell wall biosynthesis